MERVTEPELMDEDAQAKAYSEADFQAPHDRFVDLFVAAHPAALTAPLVVLDLGCGPADVTVRIARRCPGLELDGVDGSEAMLRYGRERVRSAGLTSRVHLHRALLPRDPAPRARYDIVVSNSLLHHLHDPSALWTTVTKHAGQGAFVFVMDLMRPESPEAAQRLVDENAAGEPEVLRQDFYASLRAAFTPKEIEAQLAAAGLHLRVDVVGDRHLTVSGRV